jgi:hypothetical protein
MTSGATPVAPFRFRVLEARMLGGYSEEEDSANAN